MAADGLMSLNKIQWWFVYSENIYTSPMEGITPPTPPEIPMRFDAFVTMFGP